MMKDIVIVGAGGFAREVVWLIEEINSHEREWNILGFVDKDGSLRGKIVGKYPVYMTEEDLLSIQEKINCVIGIGNPKIISQIVNRLSYNKNIKYPNLIHPGVCWDRDRIELGEGNIICAGNILTTDIKIGNNNILNLASTYGHDVVIGNCNVINPGVNVSGGVQIEDNCLIGTGAVILENILIGDNVIVGGGAVVIENVVSDLTVIGVPAKPMKK